MTRNNLTWIKGDIYLDHVHLDGKEVQFLHLILMIDGVTEAARVRRLRVCVYGKTCTHL